MTQITLNIEDPKILPSLKRVLSALNGVSIAKTPKKKSGIDLAWEDVEAGRVTRYESADDMFRKLGLR